MDPLDKIFRSAFDDELRKQAKAKVSIKTEKKSLLTRPLGLLDALRKIRKKR